MIHHIRGHPSVDSKDRVFQEQGLIFFFFYKIQCMALPFLDPKTQVIATTIFTKFAMQAKKCAEAVNSVD